MGLLGVEILTERYKKQMIRVDIVEHLINNPVDDNSMSDQILEWSRDLVLFIMHGYIFTNDNQNYINLYMLQPLVEPDEIANYSLGAIALVYLYLHLCQVFWR